MKAQTQVAKMHVGRLLSDFTNDMGINVRTDRCGRTSSLTDVGDSAHNGGTAGETFVDGGEGSVTRRVHNNAARKRTRDGNPSGCSWLGCRVEYRCCTRHGQMLQLYICGARRSRLASGQI